MSRQRWWLAILVVFAGIYYLIFFSSYSPLIDQIAPTTMQQNELENLKKCRIDFTLSRSAHHAYYHQLSCLLTALLHKPQCLRSPENITLVLFSSTGHYLPFVYEIFGNDNIAILNNSIPPASQSCGADDRLRRYSPMTIHSATTSQRKYQISSFRLVVDFLKMQTHQTWSKLGVENNNTESNIDNNVREKPTFLIIDRLYMRSIQDVDTLAKRIKTNISNSSVEIVYNERLKYWQQIAKLEQISMNHHEQSFIISPHGANLINLMYLDPSSTVNMIEICPPYTHCLCDKPNAAYWGTGICPYFYFQRLEYYVNMTYYAYVQEHIGIDCTRFCQVYRDHADANDDKLALNIRHKIRDVRSVQISMAFFMEMLRDIAAKQMNKSDTMDIAQRIYIDKVKLGTDKLDSIFKNINLTNKSSIFL